MLEFLRSLLEWVTSIIGPFVAPDWAALIHLIPIGVLALVASFYGWVLWRYRRAGPRRVGHPPRVARAPSGIHLPGPSFAPFLIALGAGALFFSVALGGAALLIAASFFVLALIAWGREAVREFDALGADHAGTALVAGSVIAAEPSGPPEGVHLPPPSLLPFLVSAGAAVLLFGVAIGLSFVLLGALMVALALVGWLLDAGREYRAVEQSDTTGHVTFPAPKRAPRITIALMSLLFLAIGGAQAGVFAGGSASASPSGSADACPVDATGTTTICAQAVAYLAPTVEIKAGVPTKLRFVNKDTGIPHNIAIFHGTPDAPGAAVFKGEIFNGSDERTYDLPPLDAGGSYYFVCSVHPNMVGTVTLQ